ncbi:hypothetical protein MTO96_000374 [Rhipicephalus appendiculatus]
MVQVAECSVPQSIATFQTLPIYFNGSSANAACSGLVEEPVSHGHAKLAKPTVKEAVLKSTEEILDLDYVNRKSRSAEVLCENTEDQGVLPSRPNLFRASQFGLRTIVEDTEEMDTTPSVKSKEIDRLQSSPLQHEDSPAKCDWDEKGGNSERGSVFRGDIPVEEPE